MMDSELQDDSDVNKSFLIVSQAIERMAVNPTEREKKIINMFAVVLANEHSVERTPSRYPCVWFNRHLDCYQGSTQIKNNKKSFYGATDKECFLKIVSYRKSILNKEK